MCIRDSKYCNIFVQVSIAVVCALQDSELGQVMGDMQYRTTAGGARIWAMGDGE